MAKNQFLTFPMNQIFWLDGNQCIKVGALSYARYGEASLGEFPITPQESERASIVKPSPDKVKESIRDQVRDWCAKYRIPFSLLGEKGVADLIEIFKPVPVPVKVKRSVTTPKKAVKKAKSGPRKA